MTLGIDSDHDIAPNKGILSGGYFNTLTHELNGLNGLEAMEDWFRRHYTKFTEISSNLLDQQPDTSTVRAIGDFLPPFSGCVGSVMIGQNELLNGDAMKIIARLIVVPGVDGADRSVRQAVVDRFTGGLRSRGSTFFKTNHFQSLHVFDFMNNICDITPPIILSEDSIKVFTSMVEAFRRRIPDLFGNPKIQQNFMRQVQRRADLNYRGDTRPILRSLAASREKYEGAYQMGMEAINTLQRLTRRE